MGGGAMMRACRLCGRKVRHLASHAMRAHAPYTASPGALRHIIAAAYGRTVPA
jgi:hypothetical protein